MDKRHKLAPALQTRMNYSSRHISFVPLQSWVKAASRCRFAIYPVLKEIGLSINVSSPSGITITVDQSKRLVVACTDRSQGEHFPFVFGECFDHRRMIGIGPGVKRGMLARHGVLTLP